MEGVSLKNGDIVDVSYQGVSYTAVVNSVFEKDEFNYHELLRLNINKKPHTNTVRAVIRKWFNEFKDIRIQTERKKGKQLNKRVIKVLGEDYQRRILKYICLGNIHYKNDKVIGFIYANNIISLKKDKQGDYIITNFEKRKQSEFKQKWFTPEKYKDYYDNLFNDYYGNNIAI